MYHSHHVDAPQPGPFKERIVVTFSEEELDNDPVIDDHECKMPGVSRQIKDELDLEVAIRERLANSIEGRIQWALQLLDLLSNVPEPHDHPSDVDDFQDAALDALEALETPSAFIFDAGFSEDQTPSSSHTPIAPNPPTCQRAPKTRSSRTPKPCQQKKHLYIELPSSMSDSQLAILACPICGRTQFTNLQGLLNHARLAHGVEWASHDACVTACAVPVPSDAESRETHQRDGVGVTWGGSVVGLRRLFERAVGVDGVLLTSLLPHTTSKVSLESPVTTPSTLLSRTLGLHADSPALAQFLGRATRRCIRVCNQDQHIDITTLNVTTSQTDLPTFEEPVRIKKGFCMRYLHRNTARKDLDLVVDVNTRSGTMKADDSSAPATIPAGMTMSRFRIMARIRLEDRSLFLKEDRRTQFGITDKYRWMLGVTAPSYSLSLPSFLTCVTVIPPKTVSTVFLTVQQQPFAVIGTANEPFMAKVNLEWVGGGKMEVEHWVELDQSRSSNSVCGSEQYLDVELDRNIPLLPVSRGCPPPLPSLDRLFPFESSLHGTPHTDAGHPDARMTKEDHYKQVIRDILPKVPMTAKDVKPRMTVSVPYKLVTSPLHLLSLVPGRRKAIEWGRARAVHALYVEHMASLPSCQRTALTVGDVYTFLEDASFFPRPSPPSGSLPELKKKRRDRDGTPVMGEESCSTCGIKRRLHSGHDFKSEEDVNQWTCTVVPAAEQPYGQRFPLTNLASILTLPRRLEEITQGFPLSPASSTSNQPVRIVLPPYQHTPRELVAINPPELILAVDNVISKLCLPRLPNLASDPTFLTTREHTEQCLAPVALLSAVLKPFISTLLRSAIEIAKQDVASVTPGIKDSHVKKMKKLTFVLTPGHILRGLRLQAVNGPRGSPNVVRSMMNCDPRTREYTALCLAQFGLRPDFGKDVADTYRHSERNTTVKAEPE